VHGLVFLILTATPSSAVAEIAIKVRLELFVGGVGIPTKARFDVTDIVAGNASLLSLFEPMPAGNYPKRFAGTDRTVILKILNREAFEKLRSVLLKTDDRLLHVKLADHSGIARFVNWAYPYKKLAVEQRLDVLVDIDISPCQRITRVVYKQIDPMMKRELERAGQTERPITLDHVFDLLLTEQIEPFMKKELTPSDRADPCFTTFTLLKWLRNQDVPGFEFSRYRLNGDVMEVLAHLATSTGDIRKSRRYFFQIDVTGYTDPRPFDQQLIAEGKHLYLYAESTGVNGARNPLSISFSGCANDRIYTHETQFVNLLSRTGTPVGDTVDDNCELGAVRAWAAVAFLRERLGTESVNYRYATGGIADGTDESSQRKVVVRITVKAGDRR
jgi:hypothetical protein